MTCSAQGWTAPSLHPRSSSQEHNSIMNRQAVVKGVCVAALVLGLTDLTGSARATVETPSPVWVGASTTILGNGGSGNKLTAFSQRIDQALTYAVTISSLQNKKLGATNA